MLRDLVPERLISGFDSPEGPAFDDDGRLHFVNWLSSSVMRIDPDGIARELYNTGGIPAGLAFHPDGTLYIADEGDDIHGLLRYSPISGEAGTFVTEYQDRPLNGANDLVYATNGVLYFSDPWRSSRDNPIGGFYRAFPDGRLEQIDTGLAFPNGVAITDDGSAVYLAETGTNRIHRYIILADESIGKRGVFATLDGPTGPDGMAFDAEGRLYVAHHGAGRVDVIDRGGQVVDAIVVPGKNPTNVAFGGDDFRTLVITEVETQSLYRVHLPVAGQKLYGGLHHY